MPRYGCDYLPAFRLIAVHPDGFADFTFLKAKLDHLRERKGPIQLLHWGCPLLDRYAAGRCQAIHLFPPDVRAPTRHFAGKVLRQSLRFAVKFGLLNANASERVDLPHRPRRKVRPMNPEQVAALLAAAREDRLYALYVLALDSGARAGELAALTWADLDASRGEIVISKTLERTGKGREPKEPKTPASRRRVLLSAPTLAALGGHRERMRAEGHGGDRDPMFCTPKGTRLIHVHLSDRNLAPLLARAGLTGFRFHDLRHTCATLLLLNGVHVKLVSERLGHASITITLDTYSHVLPTTQSQVADKMGAILGAALEAAAKVAPAENGSNLAANGEDAV